MRLGNALEAVCGPATRVAPIADLLRREGEACLTAAGIDFASAQEDARRRGTLLAPGLIRGRPRGGGSTWQSVERRTASVETAYLNGEIVLLGRTHGIPTPANALLATLAREVATGRRAPGTVPPEELLSHVVA